eukprot:gene8984-10538_t
MGPIAVSLKEEGDTIKCLINTEKGPELVIIPRWSVYRSLLRMILCKSPSSFHAIRTMRPELSDFKLPKLKTPTAQDELLKVYEPDFSKVMKVGLLYCKEGQREESEMLFNLSTDISAEYQEFLNWIGDKVDLKGFTGYNGGLDVTMINGSKSLRHTPVFIHKTQRESNFVFLNFVSKYASLKV